MPKFYQALIFEKNELIEKNWDYLMQNLMLNRIKSILNPKNEKAKSSYALFLISLFHFENNLIK